jgi:hypothetical protein
MNLKMKTPCIVIGALWLGTLLPSPTLLHTARAQKPPETPIPVMTGTTLTTYRPSAEDVLTPPEEFDREIAVAQTPPVLEFGILPGQTQPARLWSSWGDAACAGGNFYASIGDHGAPHGTALLYEINPARKTMKMVVEVNRAAGLTDTTKYAPGKIHSPLLDGGDGRLYFFGFRGSAAQTTSELGYTGDPLLRFDPATGATEDLGAAIPYNSVAAAWLYQPAHTIYALGDHGRSMPEARDQFYAYDLRSRKLIFSGGPAPLMARALIVAPDGRAYYSTALPGTGRPANRKTKDKGERPVGVLARYDPRANEVALTGVRVPGNGVLRAASRVNAQGVAYGISQDGVIFSFDTRSERVKEIATATFAGPGYTAVCKLDSTGRYLYYVPGAHGGSAKYDTPVFQLDTRTGKRKVLAFLNGYFRRQLSYNLGGTFGLALSDDGSQLFMSWNGRPLGGKNDDFGQCAVMIMHIPATERSAT